jgi:hypothetical protein
MNPRELPIPNAAKTDAQAIELLRVWAANGAQHVAIATHVWNDPAMWGIMLVDLAKHVASAYEQTTGGEFASILTRIREGLDAEWDTETDEPFGRIGG